MYNNGSIICRLSYNIQSPCGTNAQLHLSWDIKIWAEKYFCRTAQTEFCCLNFFLDIFYVIVKQHLLLYTIQAWYHNIIIFTFIDVICIWLTYKYNVYSWIIYMDSFEPTVREMPVLCSCLSFCVKSDDNEMNRVSCIVLFDKSRVWEPQQSTKSEPP